MWIHILISLIVKMTFWTVTVNVHTTSLRKQLQPSAVGFSSDSETSTVVEERSEIEISDDKTCDMGCKTDKKPSSEPRV